MQRLFFALMLLVTQALAAGQTTSPAASRASADESALSDRDTPKEAVKRLWAAVATEDPDDVRELLAASGTQENELAVALAQMLTAGRALSTAANEKFGNDAGPIAGQMVGSRDPAMIDRAEVVMKSDDIATITVEGAIRPMTFSRGEGDRWRLDVSDYLETRKDVANDVRREDILPRQTALLKKTAGVLREAAEEIRAGTYATVKDADAAIQRKLQEAMIEGNQTATSQPAK